MNLNKIQVTTDAEGKTPETSVALRQLQEVELDIMKQFLNICVQYELTYYMLGGTLLGAVRHHGFIPWDDDIDVGMPRPDYEKFLSVAATALKSPYRLHTLQTQNCEYCYYYARMENVSVNLCRNLSFRSVIIPAWIDIFPLDGVPDDVAVRKKWLKKADFYQKLFRASQFTYMASRHRERVFWKQIAIWLFAALRLEKLIPTQWAWRKLDEALKTPGYDACGTLINFCGYWQLKEMFPKTVYGEGCLYPFEDLLLNGPEDYDFVLAQMYGDYMQPPEDADKNHHHIQFVTWCGDFDSGR